MGRSSEPFRIAVLSALKSLEASGVTLRTRGEVIEHARFHDGRRVGKTTLYRKNKSGEFVHADLIRKLDLAISGRAEKKERAGEVDVLARRLREFTEENTALVDQIAAKQEELMALRSSHERTSVLLVSREISLFVMCKIVLELAPAYLPARQLVKEFENKYAGSVEMNTAKRTWIEQKKLLSKAK
ncbi:hypothetical protein [Pseudoxanthomonas mexicana]|uniref:hypothetical protein n=1 Tax=Pseudoxanthomonas mexicana TaxID=128785 RepID=UPI0028A7E418|nr:hypothetical protein [Pseudoxanthomonas mexicana]